MVAEIEYGGVNIICIICERTLSAELMVLYNRPWSNKKLKNFENSVVIGLTRCFMCR